MSERILSHINTKTQAVWYADQGEPEGREWMPTNNHRVRGELTRNGAWTYGLAGTDKVITCQIDPHFSVAILREEKPFVSDYQDGMDRLAIVGSSRGHAGWVNTGRPPSSAPLIAAGDPEEDRRRQAIEDARADLKRGYEVAPDLLAAIQQEDAAALVEDDVQTADVEGESESAPTA
jgi:hypothetical protein